MNLLGLLVKAGGPTTLFALERGSSPMSMMALTEPAVNGDLEGMLVNMGAIGTWFLGFVETVLGLYVSHPVLMITFTLVVLSIIIFTVKSLFSR